MTKNNVRVRFAPSPTGNIHIGNIRAGMFNWLFARHMDGDFLIRIEDTDIERSKPEYVESILQSLAWFGIKSDEPILYQSARLEEHKKLIATLLEQGHAYPCFCAPKSAEQVVGDLEHGIGHKYDGTCRDKAYSSDDLKKPHAIRFKRPSNQTHVSFHDAIRGDISVEMDQLDDFVIMRQDGTPTYNFVVVVDDIFMHISHVIRGEDHISNTPKQILLYQAFGASLPVFAHVPLILGPQGQKLSKRDAIVSVTEYKKQGYLADALFNYLIRLGWSHGDQEIFSRDEMISLFSLEHVGKKGAIFDVQKLQWLNGVYIRALTYEQFMTHVEDLDGEIATELMSLWATDQVETLFELYKERAVLLTDMVHDMIALAKSPEKLDCSLIQKWITSRTKDLLRAFVKDLASVRDQGHERIVQYAKELCAAYEVKLVALAQPLRLALTGKIVSPGVFDLIAVLSEKQTVRRVQALLVVLDT